jgi:hypothetical protein
MIYSFLPTIINILYIDFAGREGGLAMKLLGFRDFKKSDKVKLSSVEKDNCL